MSNFKESTLKGERYLLVTVPENIHEPFISEHGNVFVYWHRYGYNYIEVPPGDYELIGKASEISEEQWKGIVESKTEGDFTFYKDYSKTRSWGKYPAFHLDNATPSGHSWLRSEGVEPQTTIILKIK